MEKRKATKQHPLTPVEQEHLRQQEIVKWTSRFSQARGDPIRFRKVEAEYLKTDLWNSIRLKVLSRANGKCESKNCPTIGFNLQVHHDTYDRIGGNERLEDLLALCYICHRKLHEVREIQNVARLEEAREKGIYEYRRNKFATEKYGEDWELTQDLEEVDEAFILHRYEPVVLV